MTDRQRISVSDISTGRIVHIVEASFAGVGRHVLDLAHEQAARGADVHVVYSPTRESSTFAAERYESTTVTFHGVAMVRSIGLADASALRAIFRLIRKLRPDVVHGHSTKGGIMARAIPRAGAVVLYTPNAVYSMNPLLDQRTRRIVGSLERLLSKRTDTVIAVSPEEDRHLAELGIPSNRRALVPNGIAPYERDARPVRPVLGLPADAIVYGFVGRLDDQKAPDDLLAAFEAVADSLPTAHLAMIGAGPLASTLAKTAASSPHASRIHILGEQPGRWAMDAFDVFVLPSRYEGFPYVLIEAASAGLPIITTDRACASQLITSSDEGWIVPVGDIHALGDALIEASSAEARSEVVAAQLRTPKPFTVREMADGVERVMNRRA